MQGDVLRAVFTATDANGNDPRAQATSFLTQFGSSSADDPPEVARKQAAWLQEVPLNAIA